jgi:hypothetical protein
MYRRFALKRVLNELSEQEYYYINIDNSFILDSYHLYVKETKRHKFQTKEVYSRLSSRDSSIKNESEVPNPPSDQEVMDAFIANIKENIKVTHKLENE